MQTPILGAAWDIAIFVNYLFTIVFTIFVSMFFSWYFVSKQLTKRSRDQLGKDDVSLLRDMASLLIEMKVRDDMVPLGLPESQLKRLESCLNRYYNTKESL